MPNAPRHKIRRRSEVTYEERAQIASRSELQIHVFLFEKFLLALFAFPFGIAGLAMLEGVFHVKPVWSLPISAALFTFFVFYQLFFYIRHRLFLGRLAQLDAQCKVVEDIEVANAEFLLLRGKSSYAYAVNVGDGKLMILQGDWLHQFQFSLMLDAYSRCENNEEKEEMIDFECFPTRNFTVKRFPNTGVVTKLEPRGTVVKKVRVKDLDLSRSGFLDAEIFDGFLSRIETVVEREQRFRAKVIKKLSW